MSIKKFSQDMGSGRFDKKRRGFKKGRGVMQGLRRGVMSTARAVFARTSPVQL